MPDTPTNPRLQRTILISTADWDGARTVQVVDNDAGGNEARSEISLPPGVGPSSPELQTILGGIEGRDLTVLYADDVPRWVPALLQQGTNATGQQVLLYDFAEYLAAQRLTEAAETQTSVVAVYVTRQGAKLGLAERGDDGAVSSVSLPRQFRSANNEAVQRVLGHLGTIPQGNSLNQPQIVVLAIDPSAEDMGLDANALERDFVKDSGIASGQSREAMDPTQLSNPRIPLPRRPVAELEPARHDLPHIEPNDVPPIRSIQTVAGLIQSGHQSVAEVARWLRATKLMEPEEAQAEAVSAVGFLEQVGIVKASEPILYEGKDFTTLEIADAANRQTRTVAVSAAMAGPEGTREAQIEINRWDANGVHIDGSVMFFEVSELDPSNQKLRETLGLGADRTPTQVIWSTPERPPWLGPIVDDAQAQQRDVRDQDLASVLGQQSQSDSYYDQNHLAATTYVASAEGSQATLTMRSPDGPPLSLKPVVNKVPSGSAPEIVADAVKAAREDAAMSNFDDAPLLLVAADSSIGSLKSLALRASVDQTAVENPQNTIEFVEPDETTQMVGQRAVASQLEDAIDTAVREADRLGVVDQRATQQRAVVETPTRDKPVRNGPKTYADPPRAEDVGGDVGGIGSSSPMPIVGHRGSVEITDSQLPNRPSPSDGPSRGDRPPPPSPGDRGL